MKYLSINSPHKAESFIREDMTGLDHEEAWLIFLTSANTPIAKEMVSMGTLNQTLIDNRTVLRRVLLNNAAGFILVHNHPSGNPTPGSADIKVTERLRQACELMDVKLVDHIIFTEDAFYSFSEGQTFNTDKS